MSTPFPEKKRSSVRGLQSSKVPLTPIAHPNPYAPCSDNGRFPSAAAWGGVRRSSPPSGDGSTIGSVSPGPRPPFPHECASFFHRRMPPLRHHASPNSPGCPPPPCHPSRKLHHSTLRPPPSLLRRFIPAPSMPPVCFRPPLRRTHTRLETRLPFSRRRDPTGRITFRSLPHHLPFFALRRAPWQTALGR